MYLSESEHFTDFHNPKTLVWSKEDLTYGDWYGGPEMDGTYTTSFTFPTSQVKFYLIHASCAHLIAVFFLVPNKINLFIAIAE